MRLLILLLLLSSPVYAATVLTWDAPIENDDGSFLDATGAKYEVYQADNGVWRYIDATLNLTFTLTTSVAQPYALRVITVDNRASALAIIYIAPPTLDGMPIEEVTSPNSVSNGTGVIN